MKKIILIFLSFLLLGLYSCVNISTPERGQIDIVDTSFTVKTVKDYVESNEFIDIIPEQYYQNLQATRSVSDRKKGDYQMKAAVYRFYKHCSMDDEGIITCGISNGKEINISEELFDMLLRGVKNGNKWVDDWKRDGKKYKTTHLNDEYFNNLLNYK